MRARLALAVLAVLATGGGVAACSADTGGAGKGRYHPSTVAPTSSSGGATSSAPGSRGAPSTSKSKSAPPTTHPVPAVPLRTRSVVAPDSGQTYVIKVWAEKKDTDCAAHAYGASVIHYLQAHPCFGLSRVLATTTVNGKAVGFAQRSIGFKEPKPGQYTATSGFTRLVERDGTGNLNDLLREGYRLPTGPKSVPFPNAFSALGQDNNVTIIEAWYLKGPTPDNDPALETMAKDIFLQY
jgi:hypothetical protein